MARRRKEKKPSLFSKKNLVGIFIVAIMVLSGIGYIWTGNEGSELSYNGHDFLLQGNKFYTQISGSYAEFDFHPSDLEYLNTSPEVMDYLRNVRMLYITFDPDSNFVQGFELARLRLQTDLPEHMNIFPVTGVTKNSSVYSNFPIVTCDNSTTFTPVLYFTEGNATAIIPDETCIILQVRDRYDITAVTDRLLYGIYGVI